MPRKVSAIQFGSDGRRIEIDLPFFVKITYGNNAYSSDKTLSEILTAINAGERVHLITEIGTELLVSNYSQTSVDFTGAVKLGNAYTAFTYTITSSGVSVEFKRLSKLSIEIALVSGSNYSPIDNTITLSTINDAVQADVQVELVQGGMHYPYIGGNQLEAVFGTVDPYTGKYVSFRAVQNTTFFKSECYVQPFVVHVTTTSSSATITETTTEIYNAFVANRTINIVVDGCTLGTLSYVNSNEIAINYIASYDSEPALYTVYRSGNSTSLWVDALQTYQS